MSPLRPMGEKGNKKNKKQKKNSTQTLIKLHSLSPQITALKLAEENKLKI